MSIKLMVALTAIALAPGPIMAGELYARVVDVGNALCVVVRAPEGATMLYDAGNYTGAHCLAAVRDIVGSDDIDLVVLSHSDADHIGELAAILEAYQGRVARLVHTGRPGTSGIVWPAAKAAIESLTTRPREVRSLEADPLPNVLDPPTGVARAEPWSIALGSAKVTFVAGWRDWPYPVGELDDGELNNVVSIVVRVEYGGKSLLLTGDTIGRIGKANEDPETCLGAEAWMVANASPLIDADVLVGQHHGGDNSSARCFIKAVSPRYVVFPAGSARYRHVRLSTARRYTGDSIPGAEMLVPGGRMFQSDRGDDQGATEWSPQRIANCRDKAGDDDIEIFLSDTPGVDARVRYRTRRNRC